MLIVTQGCNRVYYMGTDDTLDIEGGSIVLTRVVENNPLKRRHFLLGCYGDTDRAHEVLKDMIANLGTTGGLVLPDD